MIEVRVDLNLNIFLKSPSIRIMTFFVKAASPLMEITSQAAMIKNLKKKRIIVQQKVLALFGSSCQMIEKCLDMLF